MLIYDDAYLEKDASIAGIEQLPRRIFSKGRRLYNAVTGKTLDYREDDPDGDKKIGRKVKLSLRKMYPEIMGGSYRTRPDITITLRKKDKNGVHEVIL